MTTLLPNPTPKPPAAPPFTQVVAEAPCRNPPAPTAGGLAERLCEQVRKLPVSVAGYNPADATAYAQGHEDARHAAAELIRGPVAELERRNGELLAACKELRGMIGRTPSGYLYLVSGHPEEAAVAAADKAIAQAEGSIP